MSELIMTSASMDSNTVSPEVLAAFKAGEIPTKKKCCGKCAFRKGSPERSDPYGWMTLVEAWEDGAPFFCHEGVKDHRQEVKGSPLEVCGGYAATRNMEGWKVHDLAHMNSPDPDIRFLIDENGFTHEQEIEFYRDRRVRLVLNRNRAKKLKKRGEDMWYSNHFFGWFWVPKGKLKEAANA